MHQYDFRASSGEVHCTATVASGIDVPVTVWDGSGIVEAAVNTGDSVAKDGTALAGVVADRHDEDERFVRELV